MISVDAAFLSAGRTVSPSPPTRVSRHAGNEARPTSGPGGRKSGNRDSFLHGAAPNGSRRTDRTAPAGAFRVSSLQRQPGAGPLQEKLKFLVKPLVFFFAFLALSFSLYHLGLFHFFMNQERLTAWIHSLGAWGFAGFILLQVIQVVAAPSPGKRRAFSGGTSTGRSWELSYPPSG